MEKKSDAPALAGMIFAIAAGAMLGPSCDVPGTKAIPQEREARIELVMEAGAETSRALPESGPDSYAITISQGGTSREERSTGAVIDLLLEADKAAQVEATAYKSGKPVARGRADLVPGLAPPPLALRPCAGEGSLNLEIEWPADKTRAPQISLVARSLEGGAGGGSALDGSSATEPLVLEPLVLEVRILAPGRALAAVPRMAAGLYALSVRLDDPGSDPAELSAGALILDSTPSAGKLRFELADREGLPALAASIIPPAFPLIYGRTEAFEGGANREDALLTWEVDGIEAGRGSKFLWAPVPRSALSLLAKDPLTGESCRAELGVEGREANPRSGWISLCRFGAEAGSPLRYAMDCAELPGGLVAIAAKGERGIALSRRDPDSARPSPPLLWRPASSPALETPSALAYSPGAGLLFVADPGKKAIHALDPAGRAWRGGFVDETLLAGVSGLASNAAGDRIYAICDRSSGSDILLVLAYSGGNFSVAGMVEAAADSSWRNPKRLRLSPDGGFLACAWSTGSRLDIYPVDPVSGGLGRPAVFHDDPKSTEGQRVMSLGGLRSLAFTADSEKLYAAAGSDDRVLCFERGEGGSWALGPWSVAATGPMEIAWIQGVDGSGKLALACADDARIRILSLSGSEYEAEAVFAAHELPGSEGARSLLALDGGRQLALVSGNSKGDGSIAFLERTPR